MNRKLKVVAFKAGGTGNAIFTSPQAFTEHNAFARREHAALRTLRTHLAAGTPRDDAEAFLREDLKALGEVNESYIQAILANPDRSPETIFACPADLMEA